MSRGSEATYLIDEVLAVLVETRGKLYTSPELATMIPANKNSVDDVLDRLTRDFGIEKIKLKREDAHDHRVGASGRLPVFAYSATQEQIEKDLTRPGRATYTATTTLISLDEAKKRKSRAREQSDDDPTQ